MTPLGRDDSEALFDASLIAPIGDGAVLRRGDLHPIKVARRRHDIVGKPDTQSHARSARPDAREMGPSCATSTDGSLPTRTEGRGKEAARGLLKVHALAREQVSSLGMHI